MKNLIAILMEVLDEQIASFTIFLKTQKELRESILDKDSDAFYHALHTMQHNMRITEEMEQERETLFHNIRIEYNMPEDAQLRDLLAHVHPAQAEELIKQQHTLQLLLWDVQNTNISIASFIEARIATFNTLMAELYPARKDASYQANGLYSNGINAHSTHNIINHTL